VGSDRTGLVNGRYDGAIADPAHRVETRLPLEGELLGNQDVAAKVREILSRSLHDAGVDGRKIPISVELHAVEIAAPGNHIEVFRLDRHADLVMRRRIRVKRRIALG
jgi:hypothetical protein